MRPTAIDLRLLRQFVAVAEELHFRRAAARLNISQPPLTAAIRRLEIEIGATLIERGRRTVALTPAGRTLLGAARHLLRQAEEAVAATRDAAAGRIGLVRLGYVGSAMYGRLPVAIAAFRKAFPDIRLVLREATTSAQVQALRSGELDAAVVLPSLPDAAGLALVPFDRDRLAAIVPAGHRVARLPAGGLSDLATERFVLWPAEEGQGFHARAIRVCAAAGFVPEVIQEAHGMHAVLSLVAAGAGVSLVPSRMARLQPDAVATLPIDCPEAEFAYAVAHAADRAEPATTRFVGHLAADSAGLSRLYPNGI